MEVNVQKLTQVNQQKLINKVLDKVEISKLIKDLNISDEKLTNIEIKGYFSTYKYDNQKDVEKTTLLISLSNSTLIEVSTLANTLEIEVIRLYTIIDKEDERIIQKYLVEDNNIELLSELPYSDTFFNFFDEDTSQDNKVSATANWYDGCLSWSDPSGTTNYRHCGSDCGDDLTYGGGRPINDLDYCCRAHDRCYSAFGYNDCGCDQDLGQCAERTTDPGWYWVGTWAYEKSCN